MADAGWVVELAKYIGGGVAGWLSHVFSRRGKSRRVRRHLYKEIGENYARADTALRGSDPGAVRELPSILNFDYFAHAQKDMDTFHGLGDYSTILGFYRAYRDIAAKSGFDDAPIVAAAQRANTWLDGFVANPLNKIGKALVESASPSLRKRMRQNAARLLAANRKAKAASKRARDASTETK